MINFSRNQQLVYYALYQSKTADTLNEKLTGETTITYSDPVPIWIYVSPAKGEAVIEPFGQNEDYTNVMSITDPHCPIKEDTILWIGKTPNDGKHNYRVTKVARGLNTTLYAIKKVSLS